MFVLVIDPDHFISEGSCIEGHLLFMCLRYADHCSSDTMTTQLIENTIASLQYLTKVFQTPLTAYLYNKYPHSITRITCIYCVIGWVTLLVYCSV